MEIEVFNEILGENLEPIQDKIDIIIPFQIQNVFMKYLNGLMTQATTKGQSLDFMIY